jgi:hypothetical protein
MSLKELAEELRKKSDDELVRFQGQNENVADYRILAEKEFQRRERLEQHKLDLELMAKQVRWMKFAAILTASFSIIAAIVGAIAGAILTLWLQDKPSPKQSESLPRSSQQESAPSTSVDRTEKTESVPSKSP